MKKNLSLLSFLFLVCGSSYAEPLQDGMDWSNKILWYEGETRLATAHIDAGKPDIFYLLPTCVFAWNDEKGIKHYNADPQKPEHRKAWKLSAELADTIFATQANLFLPYYRQGTFGTPDETTYNAAADKARKDVINAFSHYLKYYNNGRPFILAGFSQGAKMVVELLKYMDDDTYRRMVAAYVVGYGITPADTMRGDHKVQHIRLAQDSTSRGVTVCFNSVTTTAAINPSLCGNNIACINPISWTTTSVPAILCPVGGKTGTDDPRFPYGTAVVPASADAPVTVSVDQVHKVLIVSGLDTLRYCLPALSTMFPEGNLHLQELFFYGDCLRRNVLLRSR